MYYCIPQQHATTYCNILQCTIDQKPQFVVRGLAVKAGALHARAHDEVKGEGQGGGRHGDSVGLMFSGKVGKPYIGTLIINYPHYLRGFLFITIV